MGLRRQWWSQELSRRVVDYVFLLSVFIVMTVCNASDFDLELTGELGTVTIAVLAAIGRIVWKICRSNGKGG